VVRKKLEWCGYPMVKKFNDKGKGKGKIGIASSRETSKALG